MSERWASEERRRFLAAEQFRSWPLCQLHTDRPYRDASPVGIPGEPGYLQIGRWWDAPPGNTLGMGFVRDERFGSAQVIKATNRSKVRQWYRSGGGR